MRSRPQLGHVKRPDKLSLSYAQQRMWFLNALEEASTAAYNIPVAVRLTGELDLAALQAALADVAGRHESLRTVFPESGGIPRQDVLALDAALPVMTVIAVTEAELPAALAVAAGRKFDTRRELPWRAHLFAVGPAEHVLLVLVHHIAGDGWSMNVLARDLSMAYAARAEGQAPGWAPPPVQYADYALWQRALLGSREDPDSLMAGNLQYWRTALAGLPEQLDLPADRPRATASSGRGGVIRKKKLSYKKRK